MQRRGRDDLRAVPQPVEPGPDLDRRGLLARVLEVQVPASPTAQDLHSDRDRAVFALEVLEGGVPVVARIDVEDDQAGDGAGDQAEAGIGPAAPPVPELAGGRPPLLELRPGDQRALAARLQRQRSPATGQRGSCLVVRTGGLAPPSTWGRVADPADPATLLAGQDVALAGWRSPAFVSVGDEPQARPDLIDLDLDLRPSLALRRLPG